MPRRAGLQRGHLKKVGPSWVGQWKERVRDPETGRVRWTTQSAVVSPLKKRGPSGRLIAIKESEARQILHETILSTLPVSTNLPAALGTVREFWDKKFLRALSDDNARRKTLEDWRTVMGHTLPVIGDKQLRHVTPEDIDRIIRPSLEKGHRRTAQKLHSRLGTFFKRAKEIRWFSGDLPTEGVRAPKHTTPEKVTLNAEQLRMLLAGDETRNIGGVKSPGREIVALLVMTGLRIGELEGLRRRRVNLSSKPSLCDGEKMPPHCLFVREQFQRVYGKVLGKGVPRGAYQELKPGNGRREIPLSTAAGEILQSVMEASKWKGPNDPVFAGQRSGKPLNTDNVMADFVRPALERLGLPLVTWHGLRHTEATLADEVGMPTGQRRRILGHSSDAMTQHYTHADVEQARPFMEQVAATFADALRKPIDGIRVIEIKKQRAVG